MEDTNKKTEFTCAHCDAKFDSRGKRNTHVDHVHKQSTTIKYRDGKVRTIIKNEDGQLICACGRSYEYFKSLVRHVKSGCQVPKEKEIGSNKENEIVGGKYE